MHFIGDTRRWLTLLILALIVIAAWLTGRDLVRHLADMESWIKSNGWIGAMVFVGVVIVFTSLFVPDTLFAVIAGALFGLAGGTALMAIAALCTAALVFAISRGLLQSVVQKTLSRRPRLAAIHQAVGTEGLRFQLLLRLSPLNPVLIHYVLGASHTRFSTYLLACLGMIPALAVEVYFGHAARHVADSMTGAAQHSTAHTVFTLSGLGIAIAVLVYITRIARRTLANYQPLPAAAENRVDTDPKTPE